MTLVLLGAAVWETEKLEAAEAAVLEVERATVAVEAAAAADLLELVSELVAGLQVREVQAEEAEEEAAWGVEG